MSVNDAIRVVMEGQMAENRFSKEAHLVASLASQLLTAEPKMLTAEAVKSAMMLLDAAEQALAEDFDGHS